MDGRDEGHAHEQLDDARVGTHLPAVAVQQGGPESPDGADHLPHGDRQLEQLRKVAEPMGAGRDPGAEVGDPSLVVVLGDRGVLRNLAERSAAADRHVPAELLQLLSEREHVGVDAAVAQVRCEEQHPFLDASHRVRLHAGANGVGISRARRLYRVTAPAT